LGDEKGGMPASTRTTEQALGPYLRAIARHWLLVIAVAIVAAAVAKATLLRTEPSYQAAAMVLVSPLPQADSNFVNTGVVIETGEPPRTVQTAAALVDSSAAAQRTAELMGKGWTAGAVESAIIVSPRGESYILAVTAQANTPAKAARLANTFAASAVSYRGMVVTHNIDTQLAELNKRLGEASSSRVPDASLTGALASRIAALSAAQAGGADPTLAVIAPAAPNDSPTGTPQWLVILLSLVGGLAIGCMAALVVDYFSRRVSDLEELEELYPVPVLATVPKMSGVGPSNLVQPAGFPAAAFEQVRLLRVQLSARERARVIMITSADAGDGKTTIATALAAAFAETGEKVILIDFDLRKPDVGPLLGLEPRHNIYAAQTLDELLVRVPELPGVQALLQPLSDATEFSLLLARVPKLLDEAAARASHVIVDAAPVTFSSETLQIARSCDQVVVALRPGHTDRKRIVTARELLERAAAPVVGVVITRSAAKGDMYGYGYGYGLQHSHSNGQRDEARGQQVPPQRASPETI